jgi:hypothetical protein
MTKADSIFWFASLTAGYSDSEDRLWLRLTHPEREATVWMTRRLTQGLIQQAYKLLSGREPSDDQPSHAEIVAPFVQKGGDASPRQRSAETPVVGQGLVSTINCSLTPKGMNWVFHVPTAKAGLACSDTEAHCLLELLFQRQKSAGWAIPSPW